MENSSITSEIDAIIARAMAEYSAAKGVDVFSEDNVADTSAPSQPEPEIVDEQPAIIPANSTSILVDESTSRFSSAAWFDNIQTKQITLAGLGGIGSYVCFLLSRLHVNEMFVYDDDEVEVGNMSGQLYSSGQVGRPKVNASMENAANFSDFYNVMCYNERFTSQSSPTDIMICGFDNMEARKVFFAKWKGHVNTLNPERKAKCLFIDGRLAAESFQILCIKGDDEYNMTRYQNEYLFDDSEAEETICSYKQTSFMANMIASVMVNLFVNFCANECDPLIPRDLPFFTEYTAETFYFKVIN